VIDANFPSGAREILPKIRARTDRPIRFVFDTHHHGDHAYANQFWREQGATIVAYQGVLTELKRVETGYFGTTPGSWEGIAKQRPDVAQSKFCPPGLLFTQELDLVDRHHRVELRHLGVAHTRGDGFVWLPAERILFTGDACVNGPYNNVNDGHTGDWVATLERALELKPRLVCPGHGRMGGPEVLEQQLAFFRALRVEVRTLVEAHKSAPEVKAAVESLRATLRQKAGLAPYLGSMFANQVEKVFVEMGGKPFETAAAAAKSTFLPDGTFVPADNQDVVLVRDLYRR
jgi:glyoxylase-like metal-dependent hydrolase (beta-lactamase superfamily II)